MAIDVTRVKRTRGGHEVRIYATDAGCSYPIHGAYKVGGKWYMRMWTEDGRYNLDGSCDFDLIEEPRTVEIDCWVNVYKDKLGAGWKTKQEADRYAYSYRIACINIKRTVTEGEGL